MNDIFGHFFHFKCQNRAFVLLVHILMRIVKKIDTECTV